MTDFPEVAIGSEEYAGVVAWANREAELLDTGREREWLETMVSKEIVYQLPLRQTVERERGNGFSKTTFHLDESYGSLLTRVLRNESAFAWPRIPLPVSGTLSPIFEFANSRANSSESKAICCSIEPGAIKRSRNSFRVSGRTFCESKPALSNSFDVLFCWI